MPDEMLQLPMVNSVLERHKGSAGALLPILHEIQAGIGYIPDAAIPDADLVILALPAVAPVPAAARSMMSTPGQRATTSMASRPSSSPPVSKCRSVATIPPPEPLSEPARWEATTAP